MTCKQSFDSTSMRGWVRGSWANPVTGETRVAFERRNQLTYSCSDVLAALMGGNASMAPRYMGFLYGTEATPTIPAITRDQTWAGFREEIKDIGASNVQIAAIAQTPQIVVDDSGPNGSAYAGNGVIFTAHTKTGTGGVYGFPVTSTDYAGALVTGNYLYHAVLLTKTAISTSPYIAVARISLINGAAYDTKPAGFELSLEWQVSFY